jgi:drug/metabolite transporter (DMT)-like permease
MTDQNRKTGILLMLSAVTIFAIQDGFSRHLAETYNVFMVIMVRYWFFAGFVVLLAARRPDGFRAAVRTRHPFLHLARASLLIAEVCVIVHGYTLIGLINSHAIFAVCPLLVAALSVPILRERVQWQNWLAIGIGLTGVLVILQPGSGVFSLASLLPLSAAMMFALYSILTRLTTRDEPAFVSLFWSGLIGGTLITFAGIPSWEPMTAFDWVNMTVYALLALIANWLLIRCYEVTEAAKVQPFAYLQIVLVTIIGIIIYAEVLRPSVVLGTAVVVAAGLYTLWHSERTGRDDNPVIGS